MHIVGKTIFHFLISNLNIYKEVLSYALTIDIDFILLGENLLTQQTLIYIVVQCVVVKVYMTDKRNMRSCIGNSSPWEKVFIATPMYVDMHNL